MKIAAIIPIKEHSLRIPEKNFKLMNGKPLFYYIINTLQKCEYIKYIIINTDSNLIKEKIKKYFTDKLIFYDRPLNLLGDDISTNKLIEDTLLNSNLDVDFYLQTHVTNPLLTKDTIEKAISTFYSSKEDSLFSVNTWYTRLYDYKGKAINHDPNKLIPTQELHPIYEENSCIYIFRKGDFLKTGKRIGKNPLIFSIDNLESRDIDWANDFTLTELLMKEQLNYNKTVLITGINGGIGKELGSFFKSKNWNVIGLDIIDKKETSCDIFYKCDLSNEDEILKVTQQIKTLNLLVNNAAYQLCKKWVDSTLDEWDKVMNTNLKSVFLLSKYLYPLLKKSQGTIINISSVHATHTSNNIGIYATSKGALVTLTRSMAIEFGKDIRVNAILPGAINTQMLRSGLKRGYFGSESEEDLVKKLSNKHVLEKIGEPKDIAEMVYFLSDNDKSGFITGQSFYVDGGASIKLSTE